MTMSHKMKFTVPQVTLISRARQCEIDQRPCYVSGTQFDVAVRLVVKGCAVFCDSDRCDDKCEAQIKITERGRFVADEQGWRPGGSLRRLTFDRGLLEDLRWDK
jgi:hypothetical protein